MFKYLKYFTNFKILWWIIFLHYNTRHSLSRTHSYAICVDFLVIIVLEFLKHIVIQPKIPLNIYKKFWEKVIETFKKQNKNNISKVFSYTLPVYQMLNALLIPLQNLLRWKCRLLNAKEGLPKVLPFNCAKHAALWKLYEKKKSQFPIC